MILPPPMLSTGRWLKLARDARCNKTGTLMIVYPAVLEASTGEQSEQHEQFEVANDRACDNCADVDRTGRAPYATRLRVILLLSVGSWALITVAIALVLG